MGPDQVVELDGCREEAEATLRHLDLGRVARTSSNFALPNKAIKFAKDREIARQYVRGKLLHRLNRLHQTVLELLWVLPVKNR